MENAKPNNKKVPKLKLNDVKTSTRAFGISILEDYDKHDDPYYRNENLTNYDTEIIPCETQKTPLNKTSRRKKHAEDENKNPKVVSKEHSDFSSFIRQFKDKNIKKIEKNVLNPISCAKKGKNGIIGPKKEDFLLNTNVSVTKNRVENDDCYYNEKEKLVEHAEYDFSLRDNFTIGKIIVIIRQILKNIKLAEIFLNLDEFWNLVKVT